MVLSSQEETLLVVRETRLKKKSEYSISYIYPYIEKYMK